MSGIQLPLTPPPCDWSPTQIADLPAWDQTDLMSIDVETRDDELMTKGPGVRRGGYIVGVGFALKDGPSHYLPFRHQLGEDNLPEDEVLRYLRDNMRRFKGGVTGANLGYDLDYLWEEGLHYDEQHVTYRDVQVAEPLLNEHRFSYSLDALATEWIGEQKDEDLLVEAARAYGLIGKKAKPKDAKGQLWRLPGRYVGAYGEQDNRLPLQLIQLQEAEIDHQGLREIYDLECATLPVLVRMRRRGVRVDQDRLDEVEARCLREVDTAMTEMTRVSGVNVTGSDVMRKAALVPALRESGFESMDAKDSVDKAFLAAHAGNPAVDALAAARHADKLLGYVKSIREMMTNGRIHCTFNQLRTIRDDDKGLKGAAYGRMSCTQPNLQQQPKESYWRRMFVPDDGLWACCDVKAQEPRMLIHFADLCGMDGAGEMAQLIRDDPDTDSHQVIANICEIKRGDAKTLFLARIYGQGQEATCNKLGLPTKVIRLRNGRRIRVAGEEGDRLIKKMDRKFPFVQGMANLTEERARERGYITTLLGRRCRFPRTQDGLNFDWTYRALNRLIQGSSADQTKAAVVAMDREGVPLQLQVHDEVDFTTPDRAYAEQAAEIMRDAVTLRVPTKIDVEVGDSWGTIE